MQKLTDLKWAERYTFIWYNAREIFHWTEEDFDRRAREMHEQGITTAITFSSTHFRFSFIPWWDDIHRCLANMVKACHKYGIKLVEHHSSNLRFNPLNDEDWTYMSNPCHPAG